jgi:hypothetical protein
VGVLEDLFNLGNGIRSGFEDVPSFLKNVATANGHGIATDGRKLIGDTGDVIEGAETLGIDIGKVPAEYAGTVGKFADSPILSAAQLAIEAEKALTGSGDPQRGDGYQQSAAKLVEAVETLHTARVNPDIWDGAAASTYDNSNELHRKKVSDVSDADRLLGDILDNEAGQVSRTRQTLDDASQYLYDYGLATSWMNLVPGLNVAKLIADTTAATAALGTTETAIVILAKNALENANRINDPTAVYDDAAKDISGKDSCGGFTDSPKDDQKENLPTRLHSDAPYTYPKSIEPPKSPWPPGIPWGSATDAPSGAVPTPAPQHH